MGEWGRLATLILSVEHRWCFCEDAEDSPSPQWISTLDLNLPCNRHAVTLCVICSSSHMPKPKQWAITDQDDKFITYRYEAPPGSESGLWVNLRWSNKRQLYTAFQSNAIDGAETWFRSPGR
jgi:hypothetical protein